MRIIETGFKIRTKTRATRGKNFWISNPIASGITRPKAIVKIFWYGTPNLARSKIDFPSVKIHNGIMPNAAIVEIVVIAMLRLMLPPKISVHILLAPPPGEIPVKNNPRAISCDVGKRRYPSPYDVNGIRINWQTKHITGPIGRFIISERVCKLSAAPKLMYKIETNMMTEYVKRLSISRLGRRMVTLSDSLDFWVSFSFLLIVAYMRVWPIEVNGMRGNFN